MILSSITLFNVPVVIVKLLGSVQAGSSGETRPLTLLLFVAVPVVGGME